MFGTVVLLINALRAQSLPGFAECDCAGGLAETFVPFALSLPVTIFAGGALHYLTRKLESFDLEMRLATLNLLDHLASQCCGRR
jgi:biopolymer transport protein ExbB/TolQ